MSAPPALSATKAPLWRRSWTAWRRIVPELSKDKGTDAAWAIMTTDTVRKEVAYEMELSGGTVRIGAMAKAPV